MFKKINLFIVLILAISLMLPAAQPTNAAPAAEVQFTILHTNDFHGQLEPSNADPIKSSNPGMARTANVINMIRSAKGADNVLLVDAGDEMQGSLLSNLGDGTPTGKGIPTIATFNQMGYDVATFGNHEFDWGQLNLANRVAQAAYPYVTANIVKNDTGNCATAGWERPDFADAAYSIQTVGSPNTVKVAFIGVTTTEVPIITVATATAGLCFKDPTASILHYYDEMKAQADVIVVLSHLGYADGGYGYGIPVIGDQTLAANLIKAGKPANLIIGGHSHTSVAGAGTTVTVTGYTAKTLVAQAAYNGRRVGEADITVGTDGSVSVIWKVFYWRTPPSGSTTPPSNWRLSVSADSKTDTDFADGMQDTAVNNLIIAYATNPDYLAIVNQPVGYSAVDLGRSNTTDNMMGAFIDDAIYNYLNTDTEPTNDVDLFFNNAGGIRTDWCYVNGAWMTSGCAAGAHEAALLTYGHMFTVLPFGNATAVGTMTGAQILEVINFAPNVAGMIQPAGLKYNYYAYKDFTNPPATPTSPYLYAWGAYDVQVLDKATGEYKPLDLNKTYSVGTNEFLAPAGGDGYNGFKYMKNITYWGDMLNAVNAYVSTHYTIDSPYMGPKGNGTLDSRIVFNGDGDFTYDPGEILPITILHHNDSHGNLTKGAYAGYTQLVTLIKQERLHNVGRTLLLSGGDNIQGDAMMYYFKSAGLGYAADGTPLPLDLQINPLIKAFNSMDYDAVDLGNHEFNFGSQIFKTLAQATFPILGANVTDTGEYGLAEVGVEPFVEKTLDGVNIAILGITNHRVPNYELPSNIPGLTFSDPIAKTQELVTALDPTNDLVIALTHIGFTEDPKSVEVDKNVDTNLAKTVSGVDVIVGSHSHTNPATGFGDYKYLPSIVTNPEGKPVVISQAYRYNNTLGEIIVGLRAKAGGGYEMVSSTGRYLSVSISATSPTPEDAATKALIDPYTALISAYNATPVGQTTAPIDTRLAYVAETNAANLQADAGVYELAKNGITDVDFHLSGAMTRPNAPNDLMFPAATPGTPANMKVSDMFTLMPYENSLVVLSMNGPQLKAVLERAYRNYYYYKYVPGYGGYSYYTTCMVDTNAGSQIKYNDLVGVPYDAAVNHVVSLKFTNKAGELVEVNFDDANTYYNVSTVNYLAAGSCNFNNNGVSLWPLNKIVHDTQYYVRDAVIDYATAKGTISPAIEGRLQFITDTAAPVITVNAPVAGKYLHTESITLNFGATDDVSGVKLISAALDGVSVTNGQVIDLFALALGSHTLTVNAVDKAGNAAAVTVTFTVNATVQSLKASVNRLYTEGAIKDAGVRDSLLKMLDTAQTYLNQGNTKAAKNSLNSFINLVKAQTGKKITKEAAALLTADAKYVIANPK